MPLATKASNLAIKFSYFKTGDATVAWEAIKYDGCPRRTDCCLGSGYWMNLLRQAYEQVNAYHWPPCSAHWVLRDSINIGWPSLVLIFSSGKLHILGTSEYKVRSS
jgi:hypothetical protein